MLALMRSISGPFAAALCLSMSAPLLRSQDPMSPAETHVVIDLGPLGGDWDDFTPMGINDRGEIVLQRTSAQQVAHAHFVRGIEETDIGTLAGARTVGYDLNDHGLIVGRSQTADGQFHGFQWFGGAMLDLGTLGGDWSEARGVNNRGDVVGSSTTGSGASHAFLWHNGLLFDLFTTGETRAFSINNKGWIVGERDSSAVIWRGLSIETLENLGGWSRAYKVDDAGAACGFAYSGGRQLPVIWTETRIHALPTAGGGTWESVNAMSPCGLAVGVITNPGREAAVWRGDTLYPLNAYLGASQSACRDVNASGEILGWMERPGQGLRAFLMVPSEPAIIHAEVMSGRRLRLISRAYPWESEKVSLETSPAQDPHKKWEDATAAKKYYGNGLFHFEVEVSEEDNVRLFRVRVSPD